MGKNFEECLRNDNLSLKLRKSDRNLYSAGVGCMVFAIWSVFKILLEAYINIGEIKKFVHDNIELLIAAGNGQINKGTATALLVFTIVVIIFGFSVIMAIFVWMEMYTGLSACKESVGKKKGVFYIVLAFILLLFEVFSVYDTVDSITSMLYGQYFDSFEEFEWDGLLQMVSTVFEQSMSKFAGLLLSLTCVVILLELIINAFRVKSLRKKIAGGGINEH